MSELRPIAIYLPQYHPIPENDSWWGKGFTEWTNVAKAKPFYKGQYQPHLPADLGFYDLRVPETREAQAKMAEENGIYGFCYYHYWFMGRRILERPFQEVFESKKPDFPFMLCWANENWTKRWDGGNNEILISQDYSEEDHLAHIRVLIEYFKDDRYIKVDGKPVFCVYRSGEIPEVAKMIKIWREEAAKHDMELYLCRFETLSQYGQEYLDLGFDAAVTFQPFSGEFWRYTWKEYYDRFTAIDRAKAKIAKYKKIKNFHHARKEKIARHYSYPGYVKYFTSQDNINKKYKCYPGVSPSWDNTARKAEDAILLKDASPEVYKLWLEDTVEKFKPFSRNENFLFINAWNEWAEGNHLEPDREYGSAYLDATRDVFKYQTIHHFFKKKDQNQS